MHTLFEAPLRSSPFLPPEKKPSSVFIYQELKISNSICASTARGDVSLGNFCSRSVSLSPTGRSDETGTTTIGFGLVISTALARKKRTLGLIRRALI